MLWFHHLPGVDLFKFCGYCILLSFAKDLTLIAFIWLINLMVYRFMVYRFIMIFICKLFFYISCFISFTTHSCNFGIFDCNFSFHYWNFAAVTRSILMMFLVLFLIDGFWGAIIVVNEFADFVLYSQLMHHIDYLIRHWKGCPASETYDKSCHRVV